MMDPELLALDETSPARRHPVEGLELSRQWCQS